MDVYIGTSGYSYQHWKELFYPKGVAQAKWLAFYSGQFNTVEINATFYRTFAASVYEKWYTTTPEGFRFTLKGPKTITHLKRLAGVEEELGIFFTSCVALKEKLCCVLWQFPASFKGTAENLECVESFLQQLPTTVRHVVEVRHASWFTDEFYALLTKYGIGFVINSSSRYAAAEVSTSDISYYRFHGPRELYASSYSREELEVWKDKIAKSAEQGTVYCYFNNDFYGYAITNAQLLKSLM